MDKKCEFCKGKGTYKKPRDEAAFDVLVDHYADKGHFVTISEAVDRAMEEVGYTVEQCPYCYGSGVERERRKDI